MRSRHLAFRITVAVLATGLAAIPARPTTIVAPTFNELVDRAESVVVAEVVDLRSSWFDSRSGRAIVTDVVVRVERTVKGAVYAQRSLEFLGGTVGDTTLRVSGMPEFHVGDRDVLFIRESGRPVSPLVGFMYGRFRIVHDSRNGIDAVRSFDGRPIATVQDVGNARPPVSVAPDRTMSVDEFLAAVDARVRSERR